VNNERILKIISDHHEPIAKFAVESYRADGRGVVKIGFPDVPPGSTVMAVRSMTYHTLEQIREIAGGLAGDTAADAAVLVRMIETYDPERQAVVTAAIDGQAPISIKMKLELPIISPQPPGMH
jgi:hypothetical protein